METRAQEKKQLRLTDAYNVAKMGKLYVFYDAEDTYFARPSPALVEYIDSAYRMEDPMHVSYVPNTDSLKMLFKGNVVKEYDTHMSVNKSYVAKDPTCEDSVVKTLAGIASMPHKEDTDAMALESGKDKDSVTLFDVTNKTYVQRMATADAADVTRVMAWESAGSGTTAMVVTDSNLLTEVFDARCNKRVFTIKGDNLTLPIQGSDMVYTLAPAAKSSRMYELRLSRLGKNAMSEHCISDKLPPTPVGLFGDERRVLYAYHDVYDDVHKVRHYDARASDEERAMPTTKKYVELTGLRNARVLTCAIANDRVYIVTDRFMTTYRTAAIDSASTDADGSEVKPTASATVYYDHLQKKPVAAMFMPGGRIHLIFDDSSVITLAVLA